MESHSAPRLGHYHPRPALDLELFLLLLLSLITKCNTFPKSHTESGCMCEEVKPRVTRSLFAAPWGRRWRWCWWRGERSTSRRCTGSVSAGQSDVFLQQSRFLVSLAVRLQNLQRPVTMESLMGGVTEVRVTRRLSAAVEFEFYCCLVSICTMLFMRNHTLTYLLSLLSLVSLFYSDSSLGKMWKNSCMHSLCVSWFYMLCSQR